MPATLLEAFKNPFDNIVDTSSYTRTSLDSIKNPLYTGPHNYRTSNTVSDISSLQVSEDELLSTMSEIKDKDNISAPLGSQQVPPQQVPPQQVHSQTHPVHDSCDNTLHHVLSCQSCRKLLKELLLEDKPKSVERFVSESESEGWFQTIFSQEPVGSIVHSILIGIVIIIVLETVVLLSKKLK
jgi:hypothetical protein